MRKVVPSLILLFVYYGLISMMSGQSELPTLPFRYLDKGIHYLEYIPIGFLSFRFYYYFLPNCRIAWLVLWSFGTGLLFLCVDEYHQSFVANRDASAWDGLVDGLGVATGIALYEWGAPLFRTWRARLWKIGSRRVLKN